MTNYVVYVVEVPVVFHGVLHTEKEQPNMSKVSPITSFNKLRSFG